MNQQPSKLQEARRRRSTGSVVDFDGKRLALARRMRRLQRTALAKRVSVTAAAITQFEKGTSRPTTSVAAELALALGVPSEFFQQGRPIEQVPASAAHFRSLRSTPAITRDQALAFAEIGLAIIDVIEQYVDLPPARLPLAPVGDEPTKHEVRAIAHLSRTELGVEPGPVPNMVRLLESHGVIVLRLPETIDPHVDAFSTDVGHRPLVLLSPLKDDRARSRFDAAHELGHLVMHQDTEPGSKIIENQAHLFASEFLAPSEELEVDLPRKVDWDALLKAKTKWGISLRALSYRAHEMGIWSDLSYRRANQHLSIQGFPEPGPLGPPESPYLIGAAANLLASDGTTLQQLAAVSRIPMENMEEIIRAGSETKPKLRLRVAPD